MLSPTPTSTTALPALASERALTLLRSLGDGEWTSVAELSRTTGFSGSSVTAGLIDLEAAKLILRRGKRVRIDCAEVRQVFAFALAEFSATNTDTS